MARNSWTGQTLAGRYQIDDLAGHGGMSSVYKANDANLKRIVAIKFIHQHLTGDVDFLRRFEAEAEAVAQLRHSNIIQVFDFSQEDGQYYMVMEFVPGESLQDRLKRLNDSGRSLTTDEIVNIAGGVCDAVDYAHKRGMIHRDVKPANILLSVQGQAILTDFGLAKLAGGTQHTAAGAVMGTALYMSPEQIRGEQVDHRTDIYALGVTLYEMVGGKPPYSADSAMTVLMMHLNDPLPDLREIVPDAPPALVEIVEKSLAKNPDDRYPSAAEMAAALRSLDDAAASPPPAPAPDVTMVAQPAGASGAPPPSSPDATVVHRPGQPAQSERGTSAAPPPPPIPPVAQDAGDRSGGLPPWLFAVAGAAIVAVVVVVLLAAGVFSGGDDSDKGIVAGDLDTPTPTATAPGETEPPTDVPTDTPTPAGPFAQINGITLSGSTYVVDYETFGYTEILPGMHVHFFFDTVTQEEAGVPGDGPWILYGGPRPFTGYEVDEKPASATEMCALAAREEHSVYADSGNCWPLPDA
ncbi:MAG: serine/threonine protein kinase [Chloroflexi bacterium]|nr:serine/threonine protein kinase [Chloroflexota bacterium]